MEYAITYEQLIEIIMTAYKDGYQAASNEQSYDPGISTAWDKAHKILGI